MPPAAAILFRERIRDACTTFQELSDINFCTNSVLEYKLSADIRYLYTRRGRIKTAYRRIPKNIMLPSCGGTL